MNKAQKEYIARQIALRDERVRVIKINVKKYQEIDFLNLFNITDNLIIDKTHMNAVDKAYKNLDEYLKILSDRKQEIIKNIGEQHFLIFVLDETQEKINKVEKYLLKGKLEESLQVNNTKRKVEKI